MQDMLRQRQFSYDIVLMPADMLWRSTPLSDAGYASLYEEGECVSLPPRVAVQNEYGPPLEQECRPGK